MNEIQKELDKLNDEQLQEQFFYTEKMLSHSSTKLSMEVYMRLATAILQELKERGYEMVLEEAK